MADLSLIELCGGLYVADFNWFQLCVADLSWFELCGGLYIVNLSSFMGDFNSIDMWYATLGNHY